MKRLLDSEDLRAMLLVFGLMLSTALFICLIYAVVHHYGPAH